jgi:O-antigen/teichoic acid export membrane protein
VGPRGRTAVTLRQVSLRVLPADTVTYAASKAVPSVLSLLTVVVFLRLAGTSSYGMYSVTLAVAVFSSNIAMGWLRQGALRFAGDETSPWGALPSWATWGSLVAAACFAAATIPLALSGPSFGLLVGAFLVAGSFACQALVVTLLQARLAARRVLLAETARAALQLAIPCLFLALVAPSGAVLLLGVALAVALAVLPFRAELPGLKPLAHMPRRSLPERAALRAWWSYGWPMSLWLSTATVLQLSDRVVIARWLGTDAAGAYAGLYDVVTGGFAMCLFPVTMAAHPRISRLWNQGRGREALEENSRALRAQLIIFLPVFASAIMFREDLVRLVLPSPTHDHASWVLPILLGAFLWQIALTLHKRLEMERRTTTMLVFLVVATTVNVGANLILVPTHGAAAAAWTTFGAAAVYLSLCIGWRLRHGYVEVDSVQ